MATEVIEKATKTINVFIADPLSDDGILPLREEKELNLNIIIDTGLTQEQLISKIANVEVLLVRSQTTVTREVIEAAKNLKLIITIIYRLINLYSCILTYEKKTYV